MPAAAWKQFTNPTFIKTRTTRTTCMDSFIHVTPSLHHYGILATPTVLTHRTETRCGTPKNEQESIAFLALFRNVGRMMRISRIDDFALKDMSNPSQPR